MHAHAPRPRFLWKLRPYYRQVAGLLVVGSVGGILMNVAIVLPAVLLGRAVNLALAVERHEATPSQVGWAALLFVAGTAATELPRIAKRYYLGVARTRFVASVRADALRGVLGWPPERSALMPVGDVMARVIGDVDVLGTGVGEVMVETWDTLLFSASLVVTMFLYDPGLATVALAPVPPALWLAKWSGRKVAHRTTVARESEAELSGVLREQLGALRLLRLFGRVEAATGRVHQVAGVQAGAEIAAIRLDEALSAIYTALLSSGGSLHRLAGRGKSGLRPRCRSAPSSPSWPCSYASSRERHGSRRWPIGCKLPELPTGALIPSSRPRSTRAVSRAGPRSGQLMSPASASRSAAPARATPVPAGLRMVCASFAYPGSPVPAVLEVDLEVPPGALVAVTGPVGSGKSALARLAAGLYLPDTGTVEIGGRPVASLDPEVRAGTVGYLGQEP